jgi:hypothetical protein
MYDILKLSLGQVKFCLTSYLIDVRIQAKSTGDLSMATKSLEKSSTTYTTPDELNFIRIIGTDAFGRRLGMLDREDALRNYKKVLRRRHNWEGLDRGKIMQAVDEALAGF